MGEHKSWWRNAKETVEAQIQEQKAQYTASQAEAGNLAIEKQLGPSKVAIHDGGFVRVSRTGTMTPLTPYEKLRSIKYLEQVQDRSGVGHALAGGPFASRQRKTISLTIATDRKVHALKTEWQMLSSDDKAGMALEAAGQAVLDALSTSAAPAPTAPQPDATDQIKKLADLHAEGILTDEEFAAKKADLLDRI